jgi:hypothetical protein
MDEENSKLSIFNAFIDDIKEIRNNLVLSFDMVKTQFDQLKLKNKEDIFEIPILKEFMNKKDYFLGLVNEHKKLIVKVLTILEFCQEIESRSISFFNHIHLLEPLAKSAIKLADSLNGVYLLDTVTIQYKGLNSTIVCRFGKDFFLCNQQFSMCKLLISQHITKIYSLLNSLY